MALSLWIRPADKRPLGDAEEVKAELNEAFPGIRFIRVDGPGPVTAHVSGIAALLLWFFRPRYPYWSGLFDGGQFHAEFEIPITRTIHMIRGTLYGSGSLAADAHFAKLSASTGWRIKHPAL
jgi:hypothetical protein